MAERRVIGPTAWLVGGAGLFIGAIAAWLTSQGNPGNMGLCIACFWRDIAGYFMGSQTGQAGLAYIRPEIIGIMLGALAAALITKEFRPRGGSAPLLRFVLGFIFMVAALVFLGCTVRVWVRLGGGDLTAIWGAVGIVIGVVIGVFVLRKGFNLGRAKQLAAPLGWILPAIAVVLLVFALVTEYGAKPEWATLTPAKGKAVVPGEVVVTTDGDVIKPADATLVDGAVVAADGTVLADAEKVASAGAMPGGLRAALWISLLAGAAIGVAAQRSRFCSIGGIRDSILVRRFDLLFGVVGLVIGATIVNMLFGQYNLGFEGQPAAHNDALGSIAAMTLAGLAAVLMGGCPLRQMIMGSEGDADGAIAVVGMFAGAGFSHWAGLASSGAGLGDNAWLAMAVMAVILGAIAFIKRPRVA
ncbi:YedE family putative selenium transporter [Anaerosoma tenue]|uniref:YedE family putative selenium transporter n=1 Tax=Anaerosoma tenue TaxID=2933588 RepID=UPI002260DB4C|nr:YedE family putative selenium transporter [Anaerosoma tenue]MCK8115034.1 YedE family putative selenium transporter [Anaerosoma tenue]